MAGKTKKRAVKRRNPMARAARKLGLKVVPSAKTYKRRPKHRKSQSPDPD